MSWLTLAATVMIVWGMPIEGVPWVGDSYPPGTAIQAFVCRSGDLWVHHDCLAIGQPTQSMDECAATRRIALQDMPEYDRGGGCMRIRLKDLAKRPGEH